MSEDAEHDCREAEHGGDRDEPAQDGPHRVEDPHLLHRQGHRWDRGDVLAAHDVDHLWARDLHRPAGADDPGVDVGDDVGEELGRLRVPGVGGDFEVQLVLRFANGRGGGGGDDGRHLGSQLRIGEDLTGHRSARRGVERNPLQPPTTGGEGEQDRRDKEQQTGESAAHLAKSGKDRRHGRIGVSGRRRTVES